MTVVIADTSVVVKWFHEEGETEVAEARAILDAHRSDALDLHVLDLTMYELGNILIRSLHWGATAVADQLDDLDVVCGPPLAPSPAARRQAADLAERHGLTFYDSLFAAAARDREATLVSADRQLIAAGLAQSATNFVSTCP